MGGGAKSESTSYSGSGQLWAQKFAKPAAQDVQSVFDQNQPGLNNMTKIAQQQVVPSLLAQTQASAPVAQQGNQFNSDVLSGKYLNSQNPYIQSVLSQLNQGISDNVNSQFAGAGRYGSDAYAGELAKQTANADSNILYQNYSDELNRMGTAAQQAGATNVANNGLLTAGLGTAAALPYTGSNALANSLGALFSGGTQHSTQTGQDPIWGAIGAGLGAAGAAFSDIRLKTNVVLEHRDPDGLGWYSWNWKADPKGHKVRGVLAHEVKELRPQAYIPNYRGTPYDGVNYGAL